MLACPTDSPEISSECPCVGHCTTVLGDDVCRSCLRTFDEVSRWLEMSEAERRQVNQRIASLKQLDSGLCRNDGDTWTP